MMMKKMTMMMVAALASCQAQPQVADWDPCARWEATGHPNGAHVTGPAAHVWLAASDTAFSLIGGVLAIYRPDGAVETENIPQAGCEGVGEDMLAIAGLSAMPTRSGVWRAPVGAWHWVEVDACDPERPVRITLYSRRGILAETEDWVSPTWAQAVAWGASQL